MAGEGGGWAVRHARQRGPHGGGRVWFLPPAGRRVAGRAQGRRAGEGSSERGAKGPRKEWETGTCTKLGVNGHDRGEGDGETGGWARRRRAGMGLSLGRQSQGADSMCRCCCCGVRRQRLAALPQFAGHVRRAGAAHAARAARRAQRAMSRMRSRCVASWRHEGRSVGSSTQHDSINARQSGSHQSGMASRSLPRPRAAGGVGGSGGGAQG